MTVSAMMSSRPDAWRPQQTAADVGRLLHRTLRHTARRGAVVGVSGGVDSATCAFLVSRFCHERIKLVYIPDYASSPDSREHADTIARSLGVSLITTDITEALQGLGVYADLDACVAKALGRRESEIKAWKLARSPTRLGLPVRWRIAALTIKEEELVSKPLSPAILMFIVSRMNYKQRMRMSVLYSLAEELQYLVVGTANRTELATGFFVRHGDGAGDIFPLSHLYKSEVRNLAAEIGVPSIVGQRKATSDTFSFAQSQEEFFFGLPELAFDSALFGFEHHLSPEYVAHEMAIDTSLVASVYADLTRRQPFLRWLTTNVYEESR